MRQMEEDTTSFVNSDCKLPLWELDENHLKRWFGTLIFPAGRNAAESLVKEQKFLACKVPTHLASSYLMI